MSIENTRKSIEEFVVGHENEVLAISGDYGVGKTYYWQKLIEQLGNERVEFFQNLTAGGGRNRRIGKLNYGYVSLFGIADISDLRSAIFSAVNLSKDVSRFRNRADAASKRFGVRLEKVPKIQEWTGGLLSLGAFNTVRNALICLDDLDRLGQNLQVHDVLGLVNSLREQHDCRVVLILNNDGFGSDVKKDYEKQLEKVVDFEVTFKPTSEEILGIVFDRKFPDSEMVQENAKKLGVSNIRVLNRIVRAAKHIEPFIQTYHQVLRGEILHNLCLFILCHYVRSPELPSIEFLASYSNTDTAIKKMRKEEVPNWVEDFNKFLRMYDYPHATEIDSLLITFVRTGVLEDQRFQELAERRNKAIERDHGVNSYRKAWRVFTGAFGNNKDLFVNELRNAFQANMESLGPSELKATVGMLRRLGEDRRADSLIDQFVGINVDDGYIAYMRRGHMDYQIDDPYFRAKINEIANESIATLDIGSAVSRVFRENATPEDLVFLSKQAKTDLIAYFDTFGRLPDGELDLEFDPSDLYFPIRALLDYENSGEPEKKGIGRNTRQALLEISDGSDIDRIRVMDWFKITGDEIDRSS
ncbi:MAG: hypothetical protein ABI878_02880 [Acidobacteriota bacterium]